MINIDYISIYILVFTLLVVLRTSFRFLGSLLSTPPKPLVLNSRELLFNALSLSYIITYLLI